MKKMAWTRVSAYQSSRLFTYIERSFISVLITADSLRIRDNVRLLSHSSRCSIEVLTSFSQTLHEFLVKGLPKGSALTAIFDCCNSGTLLGKSPPYTSAVCCCLYPERPPPLQVQ